MGLKDTSAKKFFGRLEILADILNNVFYSGTPVIEPKQLSDRSGEDYRILQNQDGTFKSDNRFRDKLVEIDIGGEKVMVGLEFQARNDRKMVMRDMEYDARRYRMMLAVGDGIKRIINIVVNFDKSRCYCPSSLKEMMESQKSKMDKHFYDYGYIDLNIYDMAEKIDMFSCEELKKVLYLFGCERDNRHFMEDIESGRLLKNMSRDAAIVCAVFLGIKLRIDDESEEIDMCKAVRDYRRNCINEGKRLGREDGKRLGRAEGEKLGMEKGEKLGKESALRSFVERLFNMKLSVLEICRLTGASREKVQEITLSLQAQG